MESRERERKSSDSSSPTVLNIFRKEPAEMTNLLTALVGAGSTVHVSDGGGYEL